MELSMTNLDLNSLTLADLKQLQRDVGKAIAGFEDRKKSEARAALEAHAKELGFTLGELVGQTFTRSRAPASPKYRHPENDAVTWSGRGRKPLWFTAALASGRSEASLAL
jgi:DNA-binding protein H-NS